MSSISRSVFQSVCEENKRLIKDIQILTGEVSADRILLMSQWRDKFKAAKDFNDLMHIAAKEYLKEHPEYDITKKPEEPRDKNGQTFDQWAEDNGCY